jgi:Polyketide cyclase / dehydrase and lipid transport
MADYHYVTTWRIKAPIERVWEEIVHLERWPSWWKYVVRVVELEPGAADGVGKRQRVLLRARLPSYTLGFDTRTTRVQPPTALEADATGGLEGTGRWALAPDDGGTLVRYTWDIRTTGWLMNLLAPVARPVFDWNHGQLMREGGQGLARRLGVELDLPEAPVRPRRRLGAAGWAVGAAAVVAVTVLARRRRAARR